MAYTYTAASLVEAVRDRGYLPVAGGPSSADILRALNREQLSYVVPILMGLGDEFFVAVQDVTLTQGESDYDIPPNSIGAKIRNVQVSIDGGTNWYNVPHTEPERAPTYTNDETQGNPAAYFIRANHISLVPAPSGAYRMRFAYYRRPDAIASSGFSVFSAWSGPSAGDYTATVASTTGMASGSFNLIDSSTYEVLIEGIDGTVTNGTTLTIPAANLTSAQVALLAASTGSTSFINRGNTPAAQLPDEAANLLTQRAASVILQYKNDPNAPLALAECERMKGVLVKMLAPRAAGLPRKIVSRYGPGWGARGAMLWWRGA